MVLLTDKMTLDQILNPSKSWFPHLENEGNHISHWAIIRIKLSSIKSAHYQQCNLKCETWIIVLTHRDVLRTKFISTCKAFYCRLECKFFKGMFVFVFCMSCNFLLKVGHVIGQQR